MGSVLLVIAIGASVLAAAAAVLGESARPDGRRSYPARALITVAAAALAGSVARLLWAILRLDLSFAYVSEQARARSAGPYRLAALWGGAEGSLLFFAALLALVLAWSSWRYGLRRRGIAVPAVILALVSSALTLAANPFERLSLPAVRGAGLTPILEHPAMLYHPPILYLGLVATVVPFAVGCDRSGSTLGADGWAIVRRWMLMAWTLLTVGLATGANWAYVELGWGGYWAWDPVENTVLMPWLMLTAAVHVSTNASIRARFPRPALGLVMAPFPLVLFGSTVTRSGRLSSVHAFAESDELGYWLGATVLAALVATAWRVRITSPAPADDDRSRWSRSSLGRAAAGGLAVFATFFVFLGVALPLVPGSDRVVPAEYYNRVGAPVLVLALVLVAVPQRLRAGLVGRSGVAVVASGLLAGVAAVLLGVRSGFALAVIAVGAVAATTAAFDSWRTKRVPVLLGHVGFVLLALGVAGSAQAAEVRTVLAPGESESFGGELTATYESFVVVDGPRPGSEASVVTARITDGPGEVAVLRPGLVSYPDRGVVLAETALHSTPRRDVQVVVRAISDDGLATFDLAERPFQQLVWWGAVCIAASGLASLVLGPTTSRRTGRVGEPPAGQSSADLRFRASSASSVEVGDPSAGESA